MGKESNLFWLIGYEDNLDFIVVSEDTGPYHSFPNESKTIKGKFHYINNFISNHFEDDKKLVVITEPAFGKCPYLDELNRKSISGGPFKRFEEIFEPLKELIVNESVKRYLQIIPKNCLKHLI